MFRPVLLVSYKLRGLVPAAVDQNPVKEGMEDRLTDEEWRNYINEELAWVDKFNSFEDKCVSANLKSKLGGDRHEIH